MPSEPGATAVGATGPSGRAVLAPLLLVALADTLGSFLVLALLPYYATEMGADPFAVGWLVASFAVAQTITAPLWGRLSDRIGRRPVIVAGLALLVVSFVGFALAGSLLLLLVSRLAQGVGGGTVSVTFALISDHAPRGERAVRIGWLTAATSGAAVVGPLLGSLLVPISPPAPGLAAAAVCVAALVAATLLLPAPGALRPASPPAASLLSRFVQVAAAPSRRLHLLIWTYAVGMFGTNAVLAVVGLFLQRRHAVDETRIWQFFALLAGASLVMRAVLLPPLLRRYGETAVLLAGGWLLALSVLALPLPDSLLGVAAATILLAAGQSLLYPSTTSQISAAGAEGEVGAVLGVQQAWGGVARIAGPLASGALLGAVGAAAPFLAVGAGLLGWAAFITLRLRRPG